MSGLPTIEEAEPGDEVSEQHHCGIHLILEDDPHSEGLVLVCPGCLERVREVQA